MAPPTFFSRTSTRAFWSLLLLLSPLSCGTLIGLDDYKEGSDGGEGGATASGGSSSGGAPSTGGADSTGGAIGSGGSPGGGGASSGGNGNVTCDDPEPLVLIDASTKNGSFELPTTSPNVWKDADDWDEMSIDFHNGETEYGADSLAYNCPCSFANGDTPDRHGNWIAWLGGFADWADAIRQTIEIPASAQYLTVKVDTNFQTEESVPGVYDSLWVNLLDPSDRLLAELAHYSNQDAQVAPGVAWTADGIDLQVDVQSYQGQSVQLEFASRNDFDSEDIDLSFPTDFGLDNVRVTAYVCP